MFKLHTLLAFSAFVGCSEYKITGNSEAAGADDTGRDEYEPEDEDFDACADEVEATPRDVTLNAECDVEFSAGTFSPVVEWNWGTSSFCGPSAVGQLIDTNGSGSIDSDDMPVLLTYQGGTSGYGGGRVVALYGDGSGIAWQTSSTYGQDGGFAIGDLDSDGWPEVVTADVSRVCALDGELGTELWCVGGLSAAMDPSGYNYPSIADMDGDGSPEVTIGNAIIDGRTGTIRGRGSLGKGAAPYEGTGYSGSYGAMSVPIDLDGDGQLELVTGNAAYDVNGTVIWSNGHLDGLVAVADFDLDGQGEIVKTSGVFLTGMESDGTIIWGPINFGGAANTNLGAPAIDDLDGDGVPEFVFAAQNSLIAMEWGGAEMWRAPIADYTGAAGPVLFDFELDGYPEVLYADEGSIRFFSGIDGTVKYSSSTHASYTILETPIVADVDGDDQVEIVLGHCGDGYSAGFGAVTTYGDADESWPPGRKVWNQHAYSITNVDELGGIPTPTPSNWPEFNSFRSGDVGAPPNEYKDLMVEILDVCEDECTKGKLYVAARLWNAGNTIVRKGVPVSLRAGEGDVIAVVKTTEKIRAGRTGEVMRFEVDSALMEGKQPLLTADEDERGIGIIFECDETNNIEAWSRSVCD
jgi:hypothetical protein